MKHMIFVTGYPGAGKTYAVKALIGKGTRLKTLHRDEAPECFAILPKCNEVWSAHDVAGQVVVATGCHRLQVTNKQGADIFINVNNAKALEYFAQLPYETFLWDSSFVGPKCLTTARGLFDKVTFAVIDTPKDVAMRQRDARRNASHHSAKPATELLHFYDRVDRCIVNAVAMGQEVVRVRDLTELVKPYSTAA